MNRGARRLSAMFPALALTALAVVSARAQQSRITVKDDCIAFAFSPDGQRIVYAARRISRPNHMVLEHDDLWEVTTDNGHKRRLLFGEKLVNLSSPYSYNIRAIRFSPDGRRLTVEMYTQAVSPPPPKNKKGPPKKREQRHLSDLPEVTGKGGVETKLLDADGKDIDIAGANTSLIKGAVNATWLADGATVVYLTEGKRNLYYTLASTRPSTGQTTPILPTHSYSAVAWDAAHNAAVAIEPSEQSNGALQLVSLDLLHQTGRVLATLDDYVGQLTVSPSGTKVAYFHDGDTLEVRYLDNPTRVITIKVPMGRYQWAPDNVHLLLKRGSDNRSDQLLWVDVNTGDFMPALQGLIYYDFALSPAGGQVAVTEPGSQVLKLFPVP